MPYITIPNGYKAIEVFSSIGTSEVNLSAKEDAISVNSLLAFGVKDDDTIDGYRMVRSYTNCAEDELIELFKILKDE